MSARSVTDPPGAGLSNYARFFEQEAYVRVLTNTFWIAEPVDRGLPARSVTRSPT